MYSFRKLLEEECALTHDLNNLENRYEDWSQAVKPSLLKLPVRSVSKSYISNTDNIKEVSYETFAFKCLDFIITVTITISGSTVVTITIVLLASQYQDLLSSCGYFCQTSHCNA
jgi:glutathione peroxidase-family protein